MNGQSVTLAKDSLNFETSLERERERRGGGGGGELLTTGKSLTLGRKTDEEKDSHLTPLYMFYVVSASATGIVLWAIFEPEMSDLNNVHK
jgi:hypothetical protein